MYSLDGPLPATICVTSSFGVSQPVREFTYSRSKRSRTLQTSEFSFLLQPENVISQLKPKLGSVDFSTSTSQMLSNSSKADFTPNADSSYCSSRVVKVAPFPVKVNWNTPPRSFVPEVTVCVSTRAPVESVAWILRRNFHN